MEDENLTSARQTTASLANETYGDFVEGSLNPIILLAEFVAFELYIYYPFLIGAYIFTLLIVQQGLISVTAVTWLLVKFRNFGTWLGALGLTTVGIINGFLTYFGGVINLLQESCILLVALHVDVWILALEALGPAQPWNRMGGHSNCINNDVE